MLVDDSEALLMGVASSKDVVLFKIILSRSVTFVSI